MLKLKLTSQEFAALEEPMKSLYTESNGEFLLGVEGLEDTAGLKTALAKERLAAKEYEKMAKQFQGLGKSPEEIAELVKNQAEADKLALEKKGEWDKLKANLLETHKVDLAKKDEEVTSMKKTLESYLVDAAAVEAIASAKGVPQLLLPHVKSSVRVMEDAGKYLVRIVDKDNSPRMNAKGDFLTIKDLVDEMKQSEVFGRAFEASGNTGSGTLPTQKAGVPGSFILSREDAKNPAKYAAAKAAAIAAGQDIQIAAPE